MEFYYCNEMIIKSDRAEKKIEIGGVTIKIIESSMGVKNDRLLPHGVGKLKSSTITINEVFYNVDFMYSIHSIQKSADGVVFILKHIIGSDIRVVNFHEGVFRFLNSIPGDIKPFKNYNAGFHHKVFWPELQHSIVHKTLSLKSFSPFEFMSYPDFVDEDNFTPEKMPLQPHNSFNFIVVNDAKNIDLLKLFTIKSVKAESFMVNGELISVENIEMRRGNSTYPPVIFATKITASQKEVLLPSFMIRSIYCKNSEYIITLNDIEFPRLAGIKINKESVTSLSPDNVKDIFWLKNFNADVISDDLELNAALKMSSFNLYSLKIIESSPKSKTIPNEFKILKITKQTK